ncbi:hypothetical protein A9P82_00875 [Arachidicoccus ginsenosidimutans]|uniref:TonB-dependent siderophore receptor n=1 Tax=Arachidicoccus sp. BS20 TaxID=1850526 RepID=UPI0007F15A73|nr:TonB-dependent siderophore receptor [Arachidicoccus sp. BS20]ANI87996.1 hypothetical protein A9P82_00875 [Arachidicoccus sp. BS20]
MGKLTTLLLFLISCISLNAQTGFLKGKALSKDHKAAVGVTANLAETPFTAMTDNEGVFVIKAPAGSYKLLVSQVGTRVKEINVNIPDGDTAFIPDIIMEETAHSLSEVNVIGSKNPFGDKQSSYVARMPLSNMENPQTYTLIPQTLLAQQIVTNYQDVFKNISGSGVASTATNGRVTMTSRGFKVWSVVTDGVSGYTMTDIDPANIERVEVIKGPAGVLFGGGAGGGVTSFGGITNIVTKRPYNSFGGNISYTAGSYGLNRLTFDVNTPLNADRTVLFRMNAARNDDKSSQDAGFTKSTFLAPSLYYQVNSRVSLNVDAEFYDRNATSPYWFTPYKKTAFKDARDLPLNYNLSFTNNDVFYHAQQLNVRAQINTVIKKNWRSQTSFVRTTNDISGPQQSLVGITDSTLTRQINAGPLNYNTLQIQQNFTGDWHIGSMRNRLVLGLDYFDYATNSNAATITVDTVNFLNPGSNYGNFNMALVNQKLATATYKMSNASQKSYSAYFSDVLNITERLDVMAALRVDRFQDEGTKNVTTGAVDGKYGQTALSPKFGLVYQPLLNKISLFANYMNGFNNVGGVDYEGKTFKPESGNQWESGAKFNLIHGLLVSTISYYHIKVYNVLRTDLEHNGYHIQDGTQLSRGVEFELNANPLRGWNLLAGYAYNHSEYLKADEGLTGTRPDGSGPVHTANLWTSYTIHGGITDGLGFGFGGVYGSDLENLKHLTGFKVPSYTIVDATIFYDRPVYRIGIKVNNLGNQQYWNNRLQLQPMRNVAVNLTLHI